MRIAQVVHGVPPEALGGTETYVAHLVSAFARQGHTVGVFARVADTAREEYAVERGVQDGYEVTRINNTFGQLAPFARSYENAEVARRFGSFLDTFVPEVVHFHHLMYLSTSCISEAVRRHIPVVMTLHDYWLICQRGRFLKPNLSVCPGQSDEGCAQCFAHLLDRRMASAFRHLKPVLEKYARVRDFLRRWQGKYVAWRPPPQSAVQQIRERMAHVRELCRAVSLFLAPSHFLREQFLAFGIPPEKVLFSECGLPALTVPHSQRVANPRWLIFGYIGVVDPVKGVHVLVEAFTQLRDAELRIYGGTTQYAPYPDRKRFLAQLHASPHIRMMGKYENHEVGGILNEVDVVVVPSIWYENAPLVIREAFLARKPVVTAAFGGMQEWVRDGVDGLLFQPRDVDDLRHTLARFITDPTLVQRLSGAFPAVQSIDADARSLIAHYQALAA